MVAASAPGEREVHRAGDDHAAVLAKSGFDPESIRRYMFENALTEVKPGARYAFDRDMAVNNSALVYWVPAGKDEPEQDQPDHDARANEGGPDQGGRGGERLEH